MCAWNLTFHGFIFCRDWARGRHYDRGSWIENQGKLTIIFQPSRSRSVVKESLNPNWLSYKSKKKTQWAWQGVKLTWLMSIFTSKEVWKFLKKNQLPKLLSKKALTTFLQPFNSVNWVLIKGSSLLTSFFILNCCKERK